MLILDKGRALDRMLTRSLPDPEPLPDVFRLFGADGTPAAFGLALDPYAGLAEMVARSHMTPTSTEHGHEEPVTAAVR